MPNLSILELLIVTGLMVLLFSGRLPVVGKSIGAAIREFKKGLERNETTEDDKVDSAENKSLKLASEADKLDKKSK